MTPQQAVKSLQDAGLTQAEIVTKLAERSVTTTAATISRIGTGAHVNPRFDLGNSLVSLCEELTKAAGKQSAAA